MGALQWLTGAPGLAALLGAVLIDTLERIERATDMGLEDGDCWRWRMCLLDKAPILNLRRLPARQEGGGWASAGPRGLRVRGLLWELERRKPTPPQYGQRGWFLATRCGDPHCINPAHAHLQPLGAAISHGFATRDAGRRLQHGQAISRGRVQYRALSDEQVRRIRTELDTPNTVLAREFGVAKSTVQAARAGRNYKPAAASPWAGLRR